MPASPAPRSFPASRPVPLHVDVPFANLYVVASERDEAVVTVLPTTPGKSGSMKATEEIVVEQDGDAISVTYPGAWKQWVLPFAAGTADITVELPTGSGVSGKTGSFRAEGELGIVDLTLSAGDVRVEAAERVFVKLAAGSAVIGRAGVLNVRSSAGSVRVDEAADGAIKASNGTITLGRVTGSLQVTGSNGDVVVDVVRGDLAVKSAHGGIRVGSVERGSARVATSYGSIEVGVPEGTAAYLDVSSEHGALRNQLAPAEGPAGDEASAEIHATTGYGDIIIRRP
ncbi:DUF4097 family beta strand repeat-containing protein [Myceligenerans crystallogenes]|uniref:DUF4097 family beta strand repeat-containing protein n=1 Tax=Myceligenerans crystallogenes TaxID=316335 RepID=A0ABN2N5E0_9MICO